MLRSDRNIAERMFENNVTKVSLFVQISSRPESADTASTIDRSSAVPLHSRGESTCLLMPSSSKALKYTTLARVLSSISVFSTFYKSLVEPVSDFCLELPFEVLTNSLLSDRSSAIRGSGCRIHLHNKRQIGSLRLGDFATTSNRIQVSTLPISVDSS